VSLLELEQSEVSAIRSAPYVGPTYPDLGNISHNNMRGQLSVAFRIREAAAEEKQVV